MKINTKKCSPISVSRSSMSNASGVGLDDRDLILKNPNKYILDEEQEEENKNDEDKCGRKTEYLVQLIYSPVKVSARTKKRNSKGSSPTRTVTEQEMNDLNACLLNFCFGDENQDTNTNKKCTDSDEKNAIEKKVLQKKPAKKKLLEKKLLEEKLIEEKLIEEKLIEEKLIEKKLIKKEPKTVLGKVQQKQVDP